MVKSFNLARRSKKFPEVATHMLVIDTEDWCILFRVHRFYDFYTNSKTTIIQFLCFTLGIRDYKMWGKHEQKKI